MTLDQLLREKREEILRVCAKHGAHNVWVLGSVARGDADKRKEGSVTQSAPWSPQQCQALEQAIAGFKKYIHTEECRANLKEGQARIRFFQQELPGRLEQLSEADVHEIVGMRWAAEGPERSHVAEGRGRLRRRAAAADRGRVHGFA